MSVFNCSRLAFQVGKTKPKTLDESDFPHVSNSAATWHMVASLKGDCWLGFSGDVFLLSFCVDNACDSFLVVANQHRSFARALLLPTK